MVPLTQGSSWISVVRGERDDYVRGGDVAFSLITWLHVIPWSHHDALQPIKSHQFLHFSVDTATDLSCTTLMPYCFLRSDRPVDHNLPNHQIFDYLPWWKLKINSHFWERQLFYLHVTLPCTQGGSVAWLTPNVLELKSFCVNPFPESRDFFI